MYLSHLLTNNLYFLIYTGQYDLAEKALQRMHELTQNEWMLTWGVLLFYLEGLYFYAAGASSKGKEEIEKAKTVYRLTENTSMLEQIEDGFAFLQAKLKNRHP